MLPCNQAHNWSRLSQQQQQLLLTQLYQHFELEYSPKMGDVAGTPGTKQTHVRAQQTDSQFVKQQVTQCAQGKITTVD